MDEIKHGCELAEHNGFGTLVTVQHPLNFLTQSLNLCAALETIHIDPADDGCILQYRLEEDAASGRFSTRVVRKKNLNRGRKNVDFVQVFKDIMKLIVLCGKHSIYIYTPVDTI